MLNKIKEIIYFTANFNIKRQIIKMMECFFHNFAKKMIIKVSFSLSLKILMKMKTIKILNQR